MTTTRTTTRPTLAEIAASFALWNKDTSRCTWYAGCGGEGDPDLGGLCAFHFDACEKPEHADAAVETIPLRLELLTALCAVGRKSVAVTPEREARVLAACAK